MPILSQQKQSQSTDFPNLRPSLDLRFALAKKLDPRITFTRGSTGTYFGPDGLMRIAGVNEPRFDYDPMTGECKGLLIEESRSNLVTYSEDFSNGIWDKQNSSISSNVTETTAPDGTNTADKLIENNSKLNHYLFQSFTSTANTRYSISFFAKAAERTKIRIAFAGPYYLTGSAAADFDLITGTCFVVVASQGSTTASIIPYPNGWYRCIASSTITNATTSQLPQIVLLNNSNIDTYQGDGNSGLYIWGAQLEQGAFPTSYIPTTNSTVTRSADTANISNISNFFNPSEGTLFVDSELPYQTNLKFPAIGFTRGSGSSNTIQFYYYNTSSPYVQFLVRNSADYGFNLSNSALFDFIYSPSQKVGVYKKFIGTYKFGEFNFYFDGKFVGRTTPNKNLPSNLSFMEIGTNGATDHRLNGHIRRITYYPIALTNQQLINLSN